MQTKIKISPRLLNNTILLLDSLDFFELELEPETIQLFGYVYHSLVEKRNAFNIHNSSSVLHCDIVGQSSVTNPIYCNRCGEEPF